MFWNKNITVRFYFLDSKGHTIEKRPTSKISEEVYDILCSEFKTDADNKEASKKIAKAQIKEKEELRIKREEEQDQLNKQKEQEIITASSSRELWSISGHYFPDCSDSKRKLG